MTRTFVAFGGNLGDPKAAFAEVAIRLGRVPGVSDPRSSRLYKTVAVGGPADQPPYWNGAWSFQFAGKPGDLFPHLMRIELELGRERKANWGPRTVDLDLAMFGSLVIVGDPALVPHPRLHCRRFVIEPLFDLDPDAIHPVLRRPIADLARRVRSTQAKLAVIGDLSDPLRQFLDEPETASRWRWFHCPAAPRSLRFHGVGPHVVGIAGEPRIAGALGEPVEPTWCLVTGALEFSGIVSGPSLDGSPLCPVIDARSTWPDDSVRLARLGLAALTEPILVE